MIIIIIVREVLIDNLIVIGDIVYSCFNKTFIVIFEFCSNSISSSLFTVVFVIMFEISVLSI